MRTALKRIVSTPELSGPALKAFTDYPALEKLTFNFLQFVSPWVLSGRASVAECTIRKALLAYDQAQGKGNGLGHRRYLETIAESAKVLSSLRVSVLNSTGQWEIWNYDQPLTEYMQRHKRWAIQIREREQPVAHGPVMIKLLAAISSTKDLVIADIDISSLLAEEVEK